MDENEKSNRSLWKEKERIEERLRVINGYLGIEDEKEALERELEAAQKRIDKLLHDVPVRTGVAATGIDIIRALC
jgi:wobble nucleotide-excising tRNase